MKSSEWRAALAPLADVKLPLATRHQIMAALDAETDYGDAVATPRAYRKPSRWLPAAVVAAVAVVLLVLARATIFEAVGQHPASSGFVPATPPSMGSVPQIRWIDMLPSGSGWAVTSGSSGRLLRTSDGGLSWTDVTPSGTSIVGHPAFFAPEHCAVLTCYVAWAVTQQGTDSPTRLWISSDGGTDWHQVQTPLPSGAVESLDVASAKEGWLVVTSGMVQAKSTSAAGSEEVQAGNLWRTTDGGKTWVKVAEVGPGQACLVARGATVIGGPYYPDCLASDVSRGHLPAVGTVSLTFPSQNRGWAAEGTAFGVGYLPLYVTGDAGQTWTHIVLPGLPAPASGLSITPKLPRFFSQTNGLLLVNAQWVSGVHGQGNHVEYDVYATRDSGRSWNRATPITFADPGSLGADPAWYFADPDHGWIAVSGRLYTTADAGKSWSVAAMPALNGVQQLDFISAQDGWAVTAAGAPTSVRWTLLWTFDGGRSWAVVP